MTWIVSIVLTVLLNRNSSPRLCGVMREKRTNDLLYMAFSSHPAVLGCCPFPTSMYEYPSTTSSMPCRHPLLSLRVAVELLLPYGCCLPRDLIACTIKLPLMRTAKPICQAACLLACLLSMYSILAKSVARRMAYPGCYPIHHRRFSFAIPLLSLSLSLSLHRSTDTKIPTRSNFLSSPRTFHTTGLGNLARFIMFLFG